MQDPIIYLHIPKTAGTSFRVSAEEYYGESNVLRDYGADSDNTSQDILEAFYDQDDLKSLQHLGLSRKLLCGHFSLPRYREVFPESRVMTFFRHPVKRVVSEFFHFTNHYGYTGTLEEFYRNPKFQNRQHHTLGGAKPTDLDFYGLTELYDTSLEMFNQRYGTNLQHSELNIGNYSPESVVEPTVEQLDDIFRLNHADITLYKLALDHFENQSTEPRLAGNIATRYRGNLGGIRENSIYGWVIDSETNIPTTLSIAVNGVILATTTANKKRPDLARKGVTPDSDCGFEVPLNELGRLKHQDSISIVTEDGSFELPNSPWVMAA